jgi:hypothetical protein
MGFIIVMSLLGLVVAAGIVIVGFKVYNARAEGAVPLTKQERREYAALIRFRQYIQTQAPEYMTLGESFARIALDEANATYEREIEQ